MTDKQSGEAIAGATVTFIDPEGNVYISLTTDADGKYATQTNKFHV